MDSLDTLLLRAKRSFLRSLTESFGEVSTLPHDDPSHHGAIERLLFGEVFAALPHHEDDLARLYEEHPWIWEYAPEAEWIYGVGGLSPESRADQFRARLAYVVWVDLARFWTERMSGNERTVVCSVSKKRGVRFKEVTLHETLPFHSDSHD